MKGYKKSVVKKSISFEDYNRALFSEEEEMREMNLIRSNCHNIYSMTVNKIALSATDDKRLVGEDKIKTFALRKK